MVFKRSTHSSAWDVITVTADSFSFAKRASTTEIKVAMLFRNDLFKLAHPLPEHRRVGGVFVRFL